MYFVGVSYPAFRAGTLDNCITGDFASNTANDLDKTKLEGLDEFFSPPRDSCPIY